MHAAAKCGSNGFGARSFREGVAPPWENTKVSRELCHDGHQGTPHGCLVQCAALRTIFLQELVRTWEPWADLAQHWLTTASPEDLGHVCKLHILQCLWTAFPPRLIEMGLAVPGVVAIIPHGTRLRSRTSIPHHAPCCPRSTRHCRGPYTRLLHVLVVQAIQQHPTNDTLRQQVKYKPKRRDKHAWGPKWASRTPATKGQKLLQGHITLTLPMRSCNYSPTSPLWKATIAGADLLHVQRNPPLSLGETLPATRGAGTPIHHEQGRPHPPHVDHGQARSCHPHHGALPSHHASIPAHPMAHKDSARLVHHHARPSFLVLAFFGPGLHGPEDATGTPPPAAPLLCPLVLGKNTLSVGPHCTM